MKAVLFDLDGTLIDTAADFIRIIQQMCREEGRALVEPELIRTQVSEGARAMVKLVYPELQLEDPVFLQHRQRFLDMYGADIAVDTDLFDGMYPLLEPINRAGSVRLYCKH
jgi:N-acetyl-D-muramate 6-phosphate phosphatase